MPLKYQVPDDKKVRVIVDSDAACEADDPFAIAHALLCDKFIVKAIFAEHFNCEGSMKQSFEEIQRVVKAMKKEVPVLVGEIGKLSEKGTGEISEASSFLIREALREDDKPLYVLCIGAITNIASAIQACPDIVPHMTVVWIGGQSHEHSTGEVREFNAGNDIEAANLVLGSGVRFGRFQTMCMAVCASVSPRFRCGSHRVVRWGSICLSKWRLITGRSGPDGRRARAGHWVIRRR